MVSNKLTKVIEGGNFNPYAFLENCKPYLFYTHELWKIQLLKFHHQACYANNMSQQKTVESSGNKLRSQHGSLSHVAIKQGTLLSVQQAS
jgi:hypothetical protein